MAKSGNGNARRSWLGSMSQSGTVAIIEAPVARTYRRRATIAFFVVLGVVGLLSATVVSHYWHPIVGLILGAFIGAVCGAVAFALIVAWPVLRVFLHWAAEIALAIVVVYGWTWLMFHTNVTVSLLVVGLLGGVPAAVGPVRRRVVAWWWCAVVRHRLRMCFAGMVTAHGRQALPLILGAKPTPAGERVWVWLRGGLSVKTFEAEGQLEFLAVECWASEVRVTRASRHRAALVRFDITRREPLAGRIVSPLPDYVPDDFDAGIAPTSPGMPPTGLDLNEVQTPSTGDTKPSTSNGRKPRNSTPPERPLSGDDNADYA